MTGVFGYILAALLAGGTGGYLLRGRGTVGRLERRLNEMSLTLEGCRNSVNGHAMGLGKYGAEFGDLKTEHGAQLIDLKARCDNTAKELLKLENKLSFAIGENRGLIERSAGELKADYERGFAEADANLTSAESALRAEIVQAVQGGTRDLITRQEVQSAFAEVARATAAQQAAETAERQAIAQRLRQQEVFGTRPMQPANPGPIQPPARPRAPLDGQGLNAQLEALNQRLAEIAGAPPG